MLCGSSFDVKDNMQPADASQDPAVEETVLQMYKETRSGLLAHGPSYSFAYFSHNASKIFPGPSIT